MSKKEEFISRLVINGKRERLSSFWPFAAWFILSFFYAGLGIYIVGLRGDIGDIISNSLYLIHIALVFTSMLTILQNVVYYSRPRPFINGTLLFFSLMIFLLWILYLVFFYCHINDSGTYFKFPPDIGFRCSKNIIVFGFIPGLLLILTMKKYYPTKLKIASMFSILFAMIVGVLANHFSCSIDQFFHIILFHFVPVGIASGIGYFFVSKFLKW